MRNRLWLSVTAVFLSCALFAEDLPTPSVIDQRVKTLLFNDYQVYKLVAYYGYAIDVLLSNDEEVQTIAAGDTIGWQITPKGHHVFIKPMAPHAKTNASVITSKRTYVFDLDSRQAVDPNEITYFVRFKYPEANWAGAPGGAGPKSAKDFNFKYKISGDKQVKPARVFDDGQFTYFSFDSLQDLPAIFIIGADGNESLVNFRMEGAYVVVERLGEMYVLRNGKRKARVTNQAMLAKDEA
jgi:type IV secretion system protein VirB9